jgi:hypothetical protein
VGIAGKESVQYGQSRLVEQKAHLDDGVFAVFFARAFPSQFVLFIYFKVIVIVVPLRKGMQEIKKTLKS